MLWQRLNRKELLIGTLGVLLAVGGIGRLCSAATISYGDFNINPPGIMFIDVRESSGTDPLPLFGPPDPFPIGLDFDPTFVSTPNYAGGANLDVTDGQLNYTIMSTTGVAIDKINLFESGAYRLLGTGTAATKAGASAFVQATVTQIDGVNVSPISLTPVSASVLFDLLANPSPGLSPWSLGLTLDVGAQLTSREIPYILGATKVEVVIDNNLATISEPLAIAYIDKKDFRTDVDIQVPEPAALALLIGGCLPLGVMARRTRR